MHVLRARPGQSGGALRSPSKEATAQNESDPACYMQGHWPVAHDIPIAEKAQVDADDAETVALQLGLCY